MAIKFLRGIYKADQLKTTRPAGFKYPLGLSLLGGVSGANSTATPTTGTFDLFLVAGGGTGGQGYGTPPQSIPFSGGGGGGAGGIRILSANTFTEITEFTNSNFTIGSTNFIPVVVGASAGNSCLGLNYITCRGGSSSTSRTAGESGGSGAGGGKFDTESYTGGSGIFGQGCKGGNSLNPGNFSAAGGAATANASNAGPGSCLCNLNGVTTSFTGTPIRYGDGGNGAPTPTNGCSGAANRGNGGNGNVQPMGAGGSGGSGIVAIRYCNPAAPTTPLATGGDCICCTGGCIIHIFTSSGFLNVNTVFSIN